MRNHVDDENPYAELGITPIINAIGSVTMLGGSTPIREVKEAMDNADNFYVPLMELEEKAGERIASMIGVPSAYIPSGAGSALTLAAAAVMAGENDDFIERLPNTTGMPNKILIQKTQRYWYDRCLEASGATLVEFGDENGTTESDLINAINEKLLKRGYRMDCGYGKLRGKAFRIAHMGNVYLEDLKDYLSNFNQVLTELNY